jgi:hypothetical protein
MKHIISSLIVLVICGCQTTRTQIPSIRPSKDVISIRTQQSLDEYTVELALVNYRLDRNGAIISESRDVKSAPRVTGKQSKWLTVNVGQAPQGVDSTISYLIDGEMVSAPAFAGVNLISKLDPLNETEVRVKGVFVSSTYDENLNLINTSVPFDAVCILGEEKVICEKETKFEQVK